MCKLLSIGKLRADNYTEFEAEVLNYVAENAGTLKVGDTFRGVPGHKRYGVSGQEMRVNALDDKGCTVYWVDKGKNLSITFADYSTGRSTSTTTTPKTPAPETSSTTTSTTTPPSTDNALNALNAFAAQAEKAGYDRAKKEDAVKIEDLEKQIEAAKNITPGTTINVTIDGQTTTTTTPNVLDPKFGMLVKMLANHENVYLYGPAGSGKNVLCEQLAKALGVEFYYQNTILTKFDVSGYKNAGGEFESTEFYKAWTNGGLYMLDEADNSQAEAVVALNAALANGYYTFPGVGRVAKNPKFYCVAAGNTNAQGATETYCGRYKWDESSRDRFFFTKIDYYDKVETAIVGEHKDVLEFVYAVRKAAADLQLPLILGYRALSKLAKYYDNMDPADLISGFILRGMQDDDVHELAVATGLLNGNKFAVALAKLAKIK